MGDWATSCAATGLPIIKGDEVAVFIIQESYSSTGWLSNLHIFNPCQDWKIVGLPIYGKYSGRGWLEEPGSDHKDTYNEAVLVSYLLEKCLCPLEDEDLWKFIDHWNDLLWTANGGAINTAVYKGDRWRKHGVVMVHKWAYEWAYAHQSKEAVKESLDEFEKYSLHMLEAHALFADWANEQPISFTQAKKLTGDKYESIVRLSVTSSPNLLPGSMHDFFEGWTPFIADWLADKNPSAEEEMVKAFLFIRHMSYIGRRFQPPINRCADFTYQCSWHSKIAEYSDKRVSDSVEDQDYLDDDDIEVYVALGRDRLSELDRQREEVQKRVDALRFRFQKDDKVVTTKDIQIDVLHQKGEPLTLKAGSQGVVDYRFGDKYEVAFFCVPGWETYYLMIDPDDLRFQ